MARGLLRRLQAESHISYVPVEGMIDEDIITEIVQMGNASELNPRRHALHMERIQRRISELGLTQAEELLGLKEPTNG